MTVFKNLCGSPVSLGSNADIPSGASSFPLLALHSPFRSHSLSAELLLLGPLLLFSDLFTKQLFNEHLLCARQTVLAPREDRRRKVL